jgi:hypothetical protein
VTFVLQTDNQAEKRDRIRDVGSNVGVQIRKRPLNLGGGVQLDDDAKQQNRIQHIALAPRVTFHGWF